MTSDTSHLDLPIPSGLREEWASLLAAPPKIKAAGDRKKLFVVRLGAEWFGFPPSMLVATQPDAKAHRLPHRLDSAVEGLVNADGRVIICISLERVFGALPAEGGSDAPRLLVFQSGGWTFAARARQVTGVEEVNFENLQSLGESASESLRRSARGLVVQDGKALTCLDEDMLVDTLTGLVR